MARRLLEQGWLDVALAIALLVAWEILFLNVVAGLLTLGPLRIAYHVVGLVLAAIVAVRTLREPLDVWQRLYPVALVPMALIAFQPMAWQGLPNPLPVLALLGVIGRVLAAVNVTYLVLWLPAWVVLRRRKDLAETEHVPFLHRQGVQVWLGVLVAAIALVLPTVAEF